MIRLFLISLLGVLALSGCELKKDPLGSSKNPIKLHFVPSVEAKVLADRSQEFKKYLEANTPYHYSVTIPQSYITIVEAFGTKRADISAMNTFGYILANDKYGAEARLTVLRHGSATFQSQIIARADSDIKSLKDLNGKKFAFVDPASTSGYLLPLKTLRDNDIKPSQTVFGMKHDSVVTMIYQRQVDAGATFYSPPQGDVLEDARRLVLSQYPNVAEEIKIVALTEPIPNDPIVFRKDMPADMKGEITEALLKFIKTPEGKQAFRDLYGVTELQPIQDSDYNVIRDLIALSKQKVPEDANTQNKQDKGK